MEKVVSENSILGKDQIIEFGKGEDMFSFSGYMNFKKKAFEVQDDLYSCVNDVFSDYYKRLRIKYPNILRESLAEKNITVKPDKFDYSYIFKFYDCIEKEKTKFGFIAKKGEILAELTINVKFK